MQELWLFDTTGFPPRWYCGTWSEGLGWAHVIADLSTFVAYMGIPIVIGYFLKRSREDVPYPRLFALFGAFIFFCGVTHLLEALTFWVPLYRMSSVLKVATGAVSLATLVVLVRVAPNALHFPKLDRINRQLREEIEARHAAQTALVQAERLAASGTLASGIAHQFNNLHTPIQGYVSLMLADPNLEANRREHLEAVYEASRRATEIADRLLAFSRPNSPNRSRYPLDALVGVATSLGQGLTLQSGVTLVREVRDARSIWVDAEASEIEQVIVNMIVNGVHAMVDSVEKRVVVRGYGRDEMAIIEVSDTGCGIPEEDLDRIFEPFYSAKGEFAPPGSAQAANKGTGLGLSVAAGIVRRHNGRIRVESEVGVGTKFIIELPRATAPEGAVAPTEAVAKTPLGQGPLSAGLPGSTVLVVDDDEAVRRVVSDIVHAAGAVSEVAADGSKALERLAQNPPVPLMVLDLLMPGVNGEQALTEIRQLPRECRPQVLLVSGDLPSLSEVATKNKDLVRSCLRKPLDVHELQSVVRELLDRPGASS